MLDENRIHSFTRLDIRLRLTYACAVVVIVLLGLGVRYPGLGLPWPLAKYGGSVLWGMMVYFIVAFSAPKADIFRQAGTALFISLLVELIRLFHAPWLDGFRMTTAGGLLLGRFFSVWNVVAYWSGIFGAVAVDKIAVRRRASTAPITPRIARWSKSIFSPRCRDLP